MAPAVWAEMGRETGDPKYVAYLNAQWHQSYDLLWDKDEHLYARDATYKEKREANGKKVFWSRGEGWVLGGLARVLEQLPANDPNRPFYVQHMQRDVGALWSSCRMRRPGCGMQGCWTRRRTRSMRSRARPCLCTAWRTGSTMGISTARRMSRWLRARGRVIVGHIYADGRLGCIQQTGPEPAFYYPASSYTYGVGGFLLAGAELKKMVAAPAGYTKGGKGQK